MELRKDYVLDRWAIISTGRASRPKQFTEKEQVDKVKKCFFCPGHEDSTPEEIGKLGDPWRMRWFPNKFPAVKREGNPIIDTHNEFFTFASAYGAHEVIVETNDHALQLWDLSSSDVKDLLGVYNERVEELEKEEHIKYVQVFKNHGRKGGTSLVHSHSQIIAHNAVPRDVREQVEASKKHDSCPYCAVIEVEKSSHRRCFENGSFFAFAPYASRFNYEIWVFPKDHVKHLNDLSDEQLSDLSAIMKQILEKLKEIGADFNHFVHYAPHGEDLHLHLVFAPRIATWAGFELSGGTIINSVSPESAAAFYRGEE